MIVKVCGLSAVGPARAAVDAGADYLGLVFAASPRRVDEKQAMGLVELLADEGVDADRWVGVFVNEPPAEVNRVGRRCHLGRVQISGDESWEYLLGLDLPAIKVVRLAAPADLEGVAEEVARWRQRIPSLLLLLDSHGPGLYGGSGRQADWDLAAQAAGHFPFVLAGGLSPGNVGLAIERVGPLGVDASSGLESNGVKDEAKIRAFVAEARRAADQRAKGGRQKAGEHV
ncbi:MAG: phosphoribosylanthranilate isomerase [Chloroflexi bacterium]|nr:phosphoribosylanthranilate isomerase [Chloroflexota bacterium]